MPRKRHTIVARRARTTVTRLDERRIVSGLLRWLAHLSYNHIRRIEVLHPSARRRRGKESFAIRGVMLADDLYLTRHRAFFRISANGRRAIPIAPLDVAKKYDLVSMQVRYRIEQERWKSSHRQSA